MKSNALCISNDIGIDSIKLTRDISTGITDPITYGCYHQAVSEPVTLRNCTLPAECSKNLYYLIKQPEWTIDQKVV